MKRRATHPKAIPGDNRGLRSAIPYLLLAGIILLVFGSTIWFGFSPLDERWLILSRMEFLEDCRNLPVLFEQAIIDNQFYRPILMLSFMMDVLLGKDAHIVFHATNILLHILCCFALLRFLIALGITKNGALLLVLTFAVHPLNVQAVAWIPGRNDTLLALFSLTSALFLLRYIREKEPASLLFHFLFFLAALLTKETAIVLPVLFVFLLWGFANEDGMKTKLVMMMLWVIPVSLRLWIQFQLTEANISGVSLPVVPEFMKGVIMQSGKMLLPVQQAIQPLSENISLLPFCFALVVLIALTISRGVKNKFLAGFGLLWMLIFLLLPTWFGAATDPAIHYEHRAYAALPGLLIFISQIRLPVNSTFVSTAALVIVLLFSLMSFHRSSVYSDELTYAKTVTEESPQLPEFYDYTGFILHNKGKYQPAINYFNEAIQLDSTVAEFYNHRGNTWLSLRQYRNAIYNYTKVLTIALGQKETFANRSLAYYYAGEYDAALRDLEKADSLGAVLLPEYIVALNDALKRNAVLPAD